MRENLIRLCCVLLGALLTLSAVMIRERFAEAKGEELAASESVYIEPEEEAETAWARSSAILVSVSCSWVM